MHNQNNCAAPLCAGVDVGSTTVKMAVFDGEEMVFSAYRRHGAAQLESVCSLLQELSDVMPGRTVKLAFTGSGAKPLADALNVPYRQEVVANASALQAQRMHVGTAIELGGQDAKIIFFGRDSVTGHDVVRDMRMNGSCAGGTGAFLDEIASLLRLPVQQLNAYAARASRVYDISGRCGVYAKTDIQPLLNQGVAKEDLVLSAFHAIAKQTIGGLAQGLDIKPPVVFEGGPLTFNPVLRRVFAERLHLSGDKIIVPEKPELVVAAGAALAAAEGGGTPMAPAGAIGRLRDAAANIEAARSTKPPYFTSREEMAAFLARHKRPEKKQHIPERGETVRAFLGIDSGSTTTKFALLDVNGVMIHSFYAPNEGDPLSVARNALLDLRNKYADTGAKLKIIAAGTTGYGELLMAKAFNTEYHTVETVAHARSAADFAENATFILDIGGQDMKAIWLDHGIITNIVVNEACSSGCGSFLENFAASLDIPVGGIADAAFLSRSPADLGSRCTVFMNSSIVTEQRAGRSAQDIMAGLCRSIIENVFTKVIRVSNLDSLGENIVVQGGTFENDAVLRAMEQYIGRQVTRAPYPGMMGAIGTALLVKEKYEADDLTQTFIGLDALENFSYTQQADLPCPYCGNHCRRSVVRFSDGRYWVTGNRCERGAVLEDAPGKNKAMPANHETPNLFAVRERLLFKNYDCPAPTQERGITIGMPRVLFMWDTAPFWTTLWRALGFRIILSGKSTRGMYENGLSAVTSDTVCFPAKLVHGHLRDLAGKNIDRIFFPSVNIVPPENNEKTSEWMCAVVKGYPLVIKNSDNPETHFGIPFDAPLFYWPTNADRNAQLRTYMNKTFGINAAETSSAIAAADAAMDAFHASLRAEGASILDEVSQNGGYAVVLASRPYQNDALVNHDLPRLFTQSGIPVLTADSLPGLEKTDLSRSRIDIVNNFHARMLASAVAAAQNEHLEYVQLVSFGCGHDAYLSDEIIRMMKEISGKTPLVLKLDESDVPGPLRIRVRSFLETISQKHARHDHADVRPLSDPYKVKFTEADKERIILVPNASHAFSRIMSAAFSAQHLHAESLDIGRDEAIRLGKKYVHNDICFPAQIVIGEALEALESGRYKGKQVAIGMAKYVGDCRLTHYTALLRKALDDAGYADIPILTNDDVDSHDVHPAFRLNLRSSLRLAFALPMIDVLEELLRKIRPYELTHGQADAAFEKGMDALVEGLSAHGIPGARRGFAEAVGLMNSIDYDRSQLRPRVLIVGEYLLNFHPGANHEIERYLEANGFEITEARMSDVIRKTYFCQDVRGREYHLHEPFSKKIWMHAASQFFELAQSLTDQVAKRHPLYKPAARLPQIAAASKPVIPPSFDAGEGILIPGEIIHQAEQGCRNFVILQPFGCLPNHVVGRGVTKKLKELYPDAQILPLDYDPDVSFANLENRLQMLVMNAR